MWGHVHACGSYYDSRIPLNKNHKGTLKNMIYCSQVLEGTQLQRLHSKVLVETKYKRVDLRFCLYFRTQACGGISRAYSLLENLKPQDGNQSKVFYYLGYSEPQKRKLRWVRDAEGGQPGSLSSCLLIVVS